MEQEGRDLDEERGAIKMSSRKREGGNREKEGRGCVIEMRNGQVGSNG